MVCIQAIEDYTSTSQNGNADGMKLFSNESKSKRYYVRTPKNVFVNLFFAISKAFSPFADNL